MRFEVRGPLRDGIACHCDECRRFSGGAWHATAARRAHVHVEDAGSLRWHAFTPTTRRGFCSRCGASLFFEHLDHDYTAIAMGSLDKPTGLALAVHIFVPEKGDYYTIGDRLPQLDDMSHRLRMPDE